jgi:hypothetical protein
MFENVLNYAMCLLDLEGDDTEAQFGEKLKVTSVHITWPKWPFLDSFFLALLIL